MDRSGALAARRSHPDGSSPRREFRYVALGDSNTAGHDASVTGIRWTDLLASAIERVGVQLTYRNFAVYGVRSEDVMRRQLAPALALRPHLLSLVCGINDVLMSPSPDIDAYAHNFRAMVNEARVVVPRIVIVTATIPDLGRHVAYRPRARARVTEGFQRLNEATRALAAQLDLSCADLAAREELATRDAFAEDGYHPSPRGHRRIALAVADALAPRLGSALKL